MRAAALTILLFPAYCWGQSWEQYPDFPGTARDDAAAFSIDTKIYFGTGYQTGWVLATDWYAYDIVGGWNTWEPIAPLPSTPRQYCTGIDGGYLFGGLDANGPLNELWQYDPGSNTWSQRASMPAAGRYASSTFTVNGRIFIANGMLDNGVPTNEFWEYDPVLDQWTQRASVPGPPRHRASSFVGPAQHGYVAGGADSSFQALNDVWSYEVASDVWTQAASMPQGRYGSDAALVTSGEAAFNGPILLAGASNDTTLHSNGYRYSSFDDTWTDLGQVLPQGIRGGAMASASGGGGWWLTLFGTGLDSSLTRRQEVYGTSLVFAVPDLQAATTKLHPNPATDQVRPDLPAHWPHADCIVRDALGRSVLETRVVQGASIDVGNLPAGRYELLVRHGDELLRTALVIAP